MRKPVVRIATLVAILSVGIVLIMVWQRQQNDIPIPFLEGGSIDLRGRLTTIGRKQMMDVVRVSFPQGTDSEILEQGKIYSVSVPDDPAIASVPLDQIFTATGSGSHSVSYFGYKYVTADAATEKQNRNNSSFQVRFPGRFFASQKARDEDSAHGSGISLFEARNGITMEATSSASGVLFERNSLYLVILNDPQPVTSTVRQPSVCGNGQTETGETCDDGNTAANDGCSATCTVESGWTCTGTSPSTCITTCGDSIRAGTEECDDGRQCSNGIQCDAVDSCVGRVPFGKENLCLTRDGDGCAGSCQIEVATAFSWTQDMHINPPRSCTDLCALYVPQRGACVESGCPAGLIPAGGGAYYRNGDTWGRNTCSFAVGVSEKYCCCRTTTLNSCGDGFKAGNEQCDDGDNDSGDGCSATCTVESGWACTGINPSICSTTCGDGVEQTGEECDDGNTEANDGCGPMCKTEHCGDSVTQVGEECDDGNLNNIDGCTTMCKFSKCGDGFKADNEQCDDGDNDSGDGCSALCAIEPGWGCDGLSPTHCSGICGDGVKQADEECDDGRQCSDGTSCTSQDQCSGTLSPCKSWDGDGCSSTCQAESGWTCAGEPNFCTRDPVCGNGIVESGEICDDSGTTSSDGCSDACAVESGWTCTGTPSVCTRDPFCGDGSLDPGEICDDGNQINGDGCSDACAVESGWYCLGYPYPSVCRELLCGNGRIDAGEDCDDGNRDDGDGCSWLCTTSASVRANWTAVGAYSHVTCDEADIHVYEVNSCNDIRISGGKTCREECAALGGACQEDSCTAVWANEALQRGGGKAALLHEQTSSYTNPETGETTTITSLVATLRHTSCDEAFVPVSEYKDPFCCCSLPHVCGNGIVETGEQCDDGNISPDDGCSSECAMEQLKLCGNGRLDSGETCDDGNALSGDGCSVICHREPPLPIHWLHFDLRGAAGATCNERCAQAGGSCTEGGCQASGEIFGGGRRNNIMSNLPDPTRYSCGVRWPLSDDPLSLGMSCCCSLPQ